MRIEMWVALTALTGVILSALVSYLVSRREIEKLKFQLQQKYVEELLSKRLEYYPKIYNCISNCVKEIENGMLSKDQLKKTRDDYNQLDSAYGVFFEPSTIDRCLDFRNIITDLIKMSDQEFSKFKSTPNKIKEFTNTIGLFELALQSEIGVHGIAEITQKGEIRRKLLTRYNENL